MKKQSIDKNAKKALSESESIADEATAACISDNSTDCSMEAFMNYSPRYKAEDFQVKVIDQLEKIALSYEQSALRYKAAIKTTEKTIKVC